MIPIGESSCPHCERPQLFPNVDIASSQPEVDRLAMRFDLARANAITHGSENIFDDFVESCEQTQAVFRCHVRRLHHQIGGETEIYATYHELERLRLNTQPVGEIDFERIRPQAEIELLGSNKDIDKIHYASLSLDGTGLAHYGPCLVILREEMVGHRSSCFEGNSAVIFDRDRSFVNCLRSDWSDRHRICGAVMGLQLNSSTDPSEFERVLCRSGAKAIEDQFIEVHVFGRLTSKSFESVRFDQTFSGHDKTYQLVVTEKLKKSSVNVS